MSYQCSLSLKIFCSLSISENIFNNSLNFVCVSQEVLRLGNTTSINERCLELQKAKSKRASKMMVCALSWPILFILFMSGPKSSEYGLRLALFLILQLRKQRPQFIYFFIIVRLCAIVWAELRAVMRQEHRFLTKNFCLHKKLE